MTEELPVNRWRKVYQRGALSSAVSEARARGYWKRLQGLIPISRDSIGMDFGCGLGHLLRQMAERMSLVFGIDAAPRMIEATKQLAAGLDNVTLFQLTDPPPQFHVPSLDIVTVNSVVELMSDDEIRSWLRWWLGSLSEDGCLLLSDIMPRKNQHGRSFIGTIKWSWRERCLAGFIYEYLLMIRAGYFFQKSYCREPEELLFLVRSCGGEGWVLPRNLDFLTTRYSLIIRKKGASP